MTHIPIKTSTIADHDDDEDAPSSPVRFKFRELEAEMQSLAMDGVYDAAQPPRNISPREEDAATQGFSTSSNAPRAKERHRFAFPPLQVILAVLRGVRRFHSPTMEDDYLASTRTSLVPLIFTLLIEAILIIIYAPHAPTSVSDFIYDAIWLAIVTTLIIVCVAQCKGFLQKPIQNERLWIAAAIFWVLQNHNGFSSRASFNCGGKALLPNVTAQQWYGPCIEYHLDATASDSTAIMYMHAPRMGTVAIIALMDHFLYMFFRWGYEGRASYTKSDAYRIWWSVVTVLLLAGREYRQRKRFLAHQNFILQLHRTSVARGNV